MNAPFSKKTGQILSLVAAVSAGLASAPSFAARRYAGQPNVGAAVPFVPLATQPGNYNYSTIDSGYLEKNYLDLLAKISKEDRDYLQTTVKALDQEFQTYIRVTLRDGIQKLSDDSVSNGSKAIPYESFLAARRDYLANKTALIAKIESLTSLPLLNQSAKYQATMRGNVIAIPNYFQMDFAPLKKFYLQQIENLDAQVNQATFFVTHPRSGSVPVKIQGFQIPDSFMNPYTSDELEAMRNDIAKKRNIGAQQQKIINQFTLFMVDDVTAKVNVFGKSNKLRINLNEEGKKRALLELEKIFFTRSVLRVKFGIPLGVPDLLYTKQQLNWDFFASTNAVMLLKRVLTSQPEKTRLQDDVTNALVTQSSRGKEVFGSGLNFFGQINSAINFVKGERQWSEMNAFMLSLVKADVEEELLLGQVGGLRLMNQAFQLRYYRSPETKAYYQALGKEVVARFDKTNTSNQDSWGDVNTSGVDNAQQMLGTIAPALESIHDKLQQAAEMQANIQELTKGNQERKRGGQRTDDLFNN